MTLFITARTTIIGAIFFTLAGCDPAGIPTLAKVGTEPLPDSTITLDGETYPLKRAIALAGRKKGEEVWAIVYEGKAYSCQSANEVSCMAALNRAKSALRVERDMGY